MSSLEWKKLTERFNSACETLILALVKHYGILDQFDRSTPKIADEIAENLGFNTFIVRKICIFLEKIGVLERDVTGTGLLLSEAGSVLAKPIDQFSEDFNDALPIFFEQLMAYIEALTYASETLESGVTLEKFAESKLLNVSPHLAGPIGNLVADEIDKMIKSGDRVVIIGFGSSILGYLIAKRIVIRGNVTCLDEFSPVREETEKRVQEEDLQPIIDFNTKDIINDIKSNSFDLCVIAGMHRFLQPEEMVSLYADIKRILHDRGVIIVLENCVDSVSESAIQIMTALATPNNTTFAPSREEVKNSLKVAGFELKGEKDLPGESETKISIIIARNKK